MSLISKTIIDKFIYVLALMLLGALPLSTAAAQKIKTNRLSSVVTDIYVAYAWMTVISISSTPAPVPLEEATKIQLEKFFTPDLARAIREDYVCKKTSKEICAIDFVLLFASQDPAVEDLVVEEEEAWAGTHARVCFTEYDKTRKCLFFKGELIKGAPRIADIIYPGPHSLREILGLGMRQ